MSRAREAGGEGSDSGDSGDSDDARARVRFRSEGGLEQIRVLPHTERRNAALSRRGLWKAAPDDDPLWDGQACAFREKELTLEELAEAMRRKRKSRRNRLAGLFGGANRDYRERAEQELAQQGDYVDPLDQVPPDEVFFDYASFLEEARRQGGRRRARRPRAVAKPEPLSRNHHTLRPQRPSLKKTASAPPSSQQGSLRERLRRGKAVRKYRDSLRAYAADRRRGSRAADLARMRVAALRPRKEHFVVLGVLLVPLALTALAATGLRRAVAGSGVVADVAAVAVAAILVSLLSLRAVALLPARQRADLQAALNRL